MTVADLARELSKFPEDVEVVFSHNDKNLEYAGCDFIVKPTELKCKIELR